jgi:hypothetical protein
VDIDKYMVEGHVREYIAGRFIESTLFKYVMLIVIVLNSVIVGVQTDEELVSPFL